VRRFPRTRLGATSAHRDFPVEGRTLLSASFFARDTATVARDVIGKLLVSRAGGVLTGGRIVEAEAYLDRDDPGSHAATKGITKRNAVMYGPPGCAYVYFTYGSHFMLNLVTEDERVAGAVLVRAIEPQLGIDDMARRRGGRSRSELANGPGKVAQALGLDLRDNGSVLGEGNVALFDAPPLSASVAVSGRVGLSAGHDRALRFYIEGNRHVSRGRTGPRRSPRLAGLGDEVRGDGARRRRDEA
jgi:DNA-3-methyladenine glycosylase